MENNNKNIENKSSELKSEGIHVIDIDGLKFRYEVSGTGSPLILMHGWGCSLETVRSIAKTASAKHIVFNIDFPGFGESQEPNEIWGVEEYTLLIEKFINKLGIENPVLIGHSFGGRVSLLLASRNKVNKVILVDAAGVKPQRPLKYYVKVYSFKLSKKIIQLVLPKEKANRTIEKMRAKRGSSDYNSASPKMKSILSKVVNEDLKEIMPLIKAPTLLIWGAKDTATPIRDAKIMEKLIPDAGLVTFENAGHYSFLDDPLRFKAVLTSFLNS